MNYMQNKSFLLTCATNLNKLTNFVTKDNEMINFAMKSIFYAINNQEQAEHYLLTIMIVAVVMIFVMRLLIWYYMKKKDNAVLQQLVLSNQLDETKQQLSVKIQQNQSLLQMLHNTELNGKAGDVVENVIKSAEGRKLLAVNDWQQLFSAVDDLYPDFKALLLQRVDKISGEQLKVFYLMRIGLTNPQIKNVTNLPRTTIWRWTNSQKWIAGGEM